MFSGAGQLSSTWVRRTAGPIEFALVKGMECIVVSLTSTNHFQVLATSYIIYPPMDHVLDFHTATIA